MNKIEPSSYFLLCAVQQSDDGLFIMKNNFVFISKNMYTLYFEDRNGLICNYVLLVDFNRTTGDCIFLDIRTIYHPCILHFAPIQTYAFPIPH